MSLARSDNSDVPASASLYHPSTPREHPQRPKGSPTTAASTVPMQRTSQNRVQNTAPSFPSPSHFQTAMFHASAPPMLFSILIASLLVELRARLSAPLPEAPPGLTVSVQADTAVHRALIWVEGRWPGLWAFPVLCAAALGTLRVVIWACATVLDRLVERADVSHDARVRVGRWEDGGSVSGSELLVGIFT